MNAFSFSGRNFISQQHQKWDWKGWKGTALILEVWNNDLLWVPQHSHPLWYLWTHQSIRAHMCMHSWSVLFQSGSFTLNSSVFSSARSPGPSMLLRTSWRLIQLSSKAYCWRYLVQVQQQQQQKKALCTAALKLRVSASSERICWPSPAGYVAFFIAACVLDFQRATALVVLTVVAVVVKSYELVKKYKGKSISRCFRPVGKCFKSNLRWIKWWVGVVYLNVFSEFLSLITNWGNLVWACRVFMVVVLGLFVTWLALDTSKRPEQLISFGGICLFVLLLFLLSAHRTAVSSAASWVCGVAVATAVSKHAEMSSSRVICVCFCWDLGYCLPLCPVIFTVFGISRIASC